MKWISVNSQDWGCIAGGGGGGMSMCVWEGGGTCIHIFEVKLSLWVYFFDRWKL